MGYSPEPPAPHPGTDLRPLASPPPQKGEVLAAERRLIAAPVEQTSEEATDLQLASISDWSAGSGPDETRPPLPAPKSERDAAGAVADVTPTERLDTSTWKQLVIKKGDSLAKIFKELGLSPRSLHVLMQDQTAQQVLNRIHPGESLAFDIDAQGALRSLVYAPDATRQLQISRDGDSFRTKEVVREPDRRRVQASGQIEDSLFLSGQRAGLSDSTIMAMAEIFGWDIDFALDIRKGDQFAVLYEQLFLGDKYLGPGRILAAEFVNQGQRHQAVLYTDREGRSQYYAPDGSSMRKAFLRTPVAFSRISSGFSLGRKHPILNRVRAHKGVDYAAPTGTPVKATGDGRITLRGNKGGYGKTVIIQHGSSYSTLYAHLSRYSGLAAGSRVRQGQVIGYVGASGLATGPHLHYEFRVNGEHRNPLKVKLPAADPVPQDEQDRFRLSVAPLLAELESSANTKVARLDAETTGRSTGKD